MGNYDIAYIFKAIDQFSAPLKKINGAMANFEKQAKKSEDRFRSFSATSQKIGRFLMFSIVAPLAGAAMYALKNSEQLETMQIRLESVAGSAANAAKIMDSIKQMSMSTGLAPEGLADAATKLLAAKYSLEEVSEKMKESAMFAVVSHGKISAETVSQIFVRMKNTKEMSARMGVMLTGAGIPILKEFQKMYGLSDKAMELIGKKAIGLKLIEPVLKKMTAEGSSFYEAYKKALMTMGTSGERIHNILRYMAADFGEALAKTFGIKDGMSGIADKLMEIEKKIAPFIKAHPALIKMVVLIGLVAVALAGVLFLLANIGIIITASIAVGMVYLYKKFAWMRDLTRSWYNGLLAIKDIIMSIASSKLFNILPRAISFVTKLFNESAPETTTKVLNATKQIPKANVINKILTNTQIPKAEVINKALTNAQIPSSTIKGQNSETGITSNILAKPRGTAQQNVNITMPSKVELTQNDKTVGFIPMNATLGHSMGHV